ncbi:MAG: monovalent cation/H+ antiporter complex subunit F [Phycisphaerales bacterium]
MIHALSDTALTLAAAAAAEAPAPAGPREGLELTAANTLSFVSNAGILLICVGIVICAWRVLRGPTLVDRAIAGDLLAIHVVAFVILATTLFQSLVLFDAVLIVSILGFVSTVATAQYIARRGTAT